MSKVIKDPRKTEKEKGKYQVTNWPAYNRSLINRGDITLYFTEEAMLGWYDDGPVQKGAQYVYSDICIETMLLFKTVFGLAYRQTQGFAQSIFMLMNLSKLIVPSYSQVSRRARMLDTDFKALPSGGPITVVVDSTGLKIYGEGEWKVRKHGYSKRRTWRKLHLGCDPDTGFIHCCSLTDNSTDDGSELSGLLDQVEEEIVEVSLDGAYDTQSCWDDLIERGITPIIPPRSNAVEWYNEKPGDLMDYPRNVAIREIEDVGLPQWKRDSGYHQRSLAETAMYRYKTIFGPTLYSRKMKSQQAENKIKIKALNIMTAQGMPVAVKIKVN